MNKHLGLIYAFSAYLFWGIIPIFWKQIDDIPSMEIVAHRMVWACVIVLALIVAMREWRTFVSVLKDKRTMLFLALASVLVTVNWAIFIWAVTNEHIVETSLGYFINPLITVLLAMIFFGEKLRRNQIVALALAAVGVGVMVVSAGQLPIISFALAMTFAMYGVMKKKVSLPATHGLAIETMIMLLPAMVYIIFIESKGGGHFIGHTSHAVMLVLGGLFTLIPLLLFAAAAKKVSMTALGMTQYLGPTCQLLIGVLIYKEPFGAAKLLAFSFIWFALFIYSVDQLNQQRHRRRMRSVSPR